MKSILSIAFCLLVMSSALADNRATAWSFYMDNDMLSDYLCKDISTNIDTHTSTDTDTNAQYQC